MKIYLNTAREAGGRKLVFAQDLYALREGSMLVRTPRLKKRQVALSSYDDLIISGENIS